MCRVVSFNLYLLFIEIISREIISDCFFPHIWGLIGCKKVLFINLMEVISDAVNNVVLFAGWRCEDITYSLYRVYMERVLEVEY